jgi:hypothetical protein
MKGRDRECSVLMHHIYQLLLLFIREHCMFAGAAAVN